MKNESNIESIAQHFCFEGEFAGSELNQIGHINTTYVVTYKYNEVPRRYVLQQINTSIFLNPDKLMENIKNVTDHIRGRIASIADGHRRTTLELIETRAGKLYYQTDEGTCWRGYKFIENATTYQLVENPMHFYHSGKAFGEFQHLLSNFPAEKLHETIPDFHNTQMRYITFMDAVDADIKRRAAEVLEDIEFVKNHKKATAVLVDLISSGQLPLRVTHNDTKFNNVMIDKENGEVICVIDLDTVMPGSSLYDFGDSIRSGATTAEEDETDLSKVSLDLELFESFTRGYLEAAGNSLSELEYKYMPFSAMLITLELGMRFLTDYLNGDVYFRIQREKHNLERARNQFRLAADIEQKFPQMAEIISRLREEA